MKNIIKKISIVIASIMIFSIGQLSLAQVIPVDSITTEKGIVQVLNTDENSGETFILKSDKKSYSGSGSFDMILSVTNLRADEYGTVQLKYNKGERINSISEYIPEQKILDIPTYSEVEVQCGPNATTTKCYEWVSNIKKENKEVDTWKSLQLENRQVKINALKKSFAGKYDDKQLRYLFKTGTTFLKVNVSYENSLTFRDEFVIEIFGDNGGYGVLDPLITNLVSYWKLDESSGNATDSSGNSNTLVNTNVTYGTGKINNGAIYNASGDYLEIADASQTGLDLSSAFSISFWYKGTVPANGNAINFLSKWTATGNQRGYRIDLYNNNGQLELVTDLGSGSSGDEVITNVTLTNVDTVFQHLVVTWNGTTKKLNWYLNGTELGEQSNTKVTSLYNSSQPFCLGNRSDAHNTNLNGMLDEVGIWSRVLTATEITALYNSGSGFAYPFVTGLTTVKTYRGNLWSTITAYRGNANTLIKSFRGNL